MTTTATIDLDQAIDWDALDTEDAVTEDAPCTTCKGETLLTCPGCDGELGCLHECDLCEDDPASETCHCDVCDDEGQVCCPDC